MFLLLLLMILDKRNFNSTIPTATAANILCKLQLQPSRLGRFRRLNKDELLLLDAAGG
jgi:hypothetical protein